ncbi:MAG: hypothetical protein ACK41E_04155 [Deinococcales bacterium]
MKRFLFLAIGLLSCAALPLRFSVNDISLTIPLVTSTNDTVIYPKDPSTFTPPSVGFTSVKLEGNAKANNVLQNVSVFLHARNTDPALDPSCNVSVEIIVCPKNGQKRINSNALVLLSSGAKQPFAFDDTDNAFRDGINSGKLWLGLEVTSGAAANMNLQLLDLIMSLTLL